MHTQMFELLEQATSALNDEQRAAAAAQAKQHQLNLKQVTADYEKRMTELGSQLRVKERELGDMEANVNTILNESKVEVERASKAQKRADVRAATAQKQQSAAEAEAAKQTARVEDLESDQADTGLSSYVRKACPNDQVAQSIASLDKIGDRGEPSGRRLSDLGNAMGKVMGNLLESTPAGQQVPVKVLEAIANRRDGGGTVAGAALREFAKNASLNSGSTGDIHTHAHTHMHTPICARTHTRTHVHTHTHTHTHTRTPALALAHPHSGVQELGMAWNMNMRKGHKEMARSNLSVLVSIKGP